MDKHPSVSLQVPLPNWHGRSDHLCIYKRARAEAGPVSSPARADRPAPSANAAQQPPRARTPTERLLPFLRGEGTDTTGRRLADMRAYTFAELEAVRA